MRFKVVILCCVLSACSEPEQKDLHGFLYFASGNYVGRFDLHDGSSSIVANLGDVTINSIDSLDSDRLLLSMVSFTADREMPRISWLDIKTGRTMDLFRGTDASYLSGTNTVVYDDGSRLVETSLRGRPRSYEEVFSHKRSSNVLLRSITDESVLFSVRDDGFSRIYYFNAQSREDRELTGLSSTCNLNGAVWISSLNKIACKVEPVSTNEQPYVLASLDAVSVDPIGLPQNRDLSALTYIADQDVLVLVERRRGLFGGRDKWTVWAHDFASGTNHILSENQYLGSSAVYRNN